MDVAIKHGSLRSTWARPMKGTGSRGGNRANSPSSVVHGIGNVTYWNCLLKGCNLCRKVHTSLKLRSIFSKGVDCGLNWKNFGRTDWAPTTHALNMIWLGVVAWCSTVVDRFANKTDECSPLVGSNGGCVSGVSRGGAWGMIGGWIYVKRDGRQLWLKVSCCMHCQRLLVLQ